MSTDLSVSQNFLKDPTVVAKLIRRSGLGDQDVVLDIGAGRGIITLELSKVCKKVIAYELDLNLYKNLFAQFRSVPNIEILNKDFLTSTLPDGKYSVFSNIPFNLTSAIVYKLVFSPNPPEKCFLIMQNEAAQRFLGRGEGTMISLLLRPFFDMEITHTFSPGDFEPRPEVNAVLFKITKRASPLVERDRIGEYRDFVVYVINQQKPSIRIRLNKIFSPEQLTRLSKDLNFSLLSTASDLTLAQWFGIFSYYCIGVGQAKKRAVKGSFFAHLMAMKKQNVSHRTKNFFRKQNL
jgi:23S rRNA (adenine-N6)-dimethyltransferase